MKQEISLPCSQGSATGPFVQPVEPNPHPDAINYFM